MRPIWLLDIDGVLNANSVNLPTHVWAEDEWILGEARGGQNIWKMTGARPVMEFITRVHEDGLAEIRWHTTWQGQAQNVADVFGLPVFPVHEAPEYQPGAWSSSLSKGMWWKAPGAWRVIKEENRPLLWTDDDIDYYMTDEERWSLRSSGQQVMLLSPDHKCGLVRGQLRKIREFLEQVRDTTPEE